MATGDTTKLIIELQTILRGLNQTLRGLDQIKKKLDSVASIKVNVQSSAGTVQAAAATQRLAAQTQELANRQERARQTSERLTLSAQRLTVAQQRANNALQADRHVQFFRNMQTAAADADKHVEFFRNHERFLKSSPAIADSHVREFKKITAAADEADSHVRFFRENELRLRQAPQLDSHVRAFRAAEAATAVLNQRLSNVGNALRSVGQGLASIGATLSVAVTAPLVAVGVASVDAAVRLDSLKRGLTAIVGSSDEAARQLQRLTQIAKLPGIGFEEAIQGSIRLQAVGFSAKEAEGALRQFSNAIALTGGGRDELARVTVQLGQLAAKGKVLSQDLRPIIEAAPAVGRALLQAFGTVNADDIQELGLSSKEFLSVLVDQLSQLPRAAAGAKNSFENFKDEVFRAAAAVGDALLPALIRLAEVVGPAVTKLAEVFAGLPQPLQLVVIGAAGLLAALGPVLFVVGQLTLGVGRLLVGFVELNATGVLPSIASLRAYTVAALNAAGAQRVLASSTALVSAGIGAGLAIIAAAVTAYAVYNAFQKDAVTLSKERADALTAEIDQLKEQAKFLDGLKTGVARTTDEQERLLAVYDKLNTTAQLRVTGISDEEKRLAALREELQRLINLREQERVQQAANIAGALAGTLQSISANEKEIDSITARIQANTQLAQSLRESGRITDENSQQLARQGIIAGGDVQQALGALQAESENLLQTQKALRDNTEQLNGTAKEQAETLRLLERQTGLSARELLVAARNMGVFRGDIDQTLALLDRYVKLTDEATHSTDAFSRALSQQVSDALRAGDAADALAKARKGLIEANAATAREAASSFEDALKFFRAFIAAQPELQRALQREAQVQGKTFDEVVQKSLEKAFGRSGRDKSGTSLRNAQEQLAKAQAEVALASSEKQVAIERQKNEQLLQAAESGQRLQLISYREFLETKAALTAESIDKEIAQQQAVVTAAKNAQARLLDAAGKAGIPTAERARRLTQAAEADAAAIKAETKLAELTLKRQLITDTLNQSLKEAQHEQLKDIRQLEIEYAELTGRIEDALKAATDEKFRETLRDLSLAQDHLNQQIKDAIALKDADRVAELQLARAQNQRQIDAITSITRQQDALAALAAANELVRRAKERQAQLEADLSFQVQFRGLQEEDAIKQRLAGEEKLNDSLVNARDTIRQIITELQAQGVEPPRALVEFVDELNTSLKGLGELSFSEQFRLVQKEFERLNDERLKKIADIERAVRERDIAEIEGLLIIRRINGQYSADLEQQLALLKSIAAQSHDATLQREADSAEQTVKDANEQLADFDRQLRSTEIDALQEGLTNFFTSLSDQTKTAKEKLLDLVNSVANRIEQVIAENLSKRLIESLFGDGTEKGGILASVRRLFGLGGDRGVGATGGVGIAGAAQTTQVTAAATALSTGATNAATALVTGGTTAGTALATGVTTASASLVASIAAAAASFSAAVIAAGAAFAAAVAAAAGAQAASGAFSGLGSFGSGLEAATGLFPAVPGGVVRIVEGGFPEAVLTTDPKHAARQVAILRAFLRETRGLGGRIRGLAMGGFAMPELSLNVPRTSVAMSGFHNMDIGSPQQPISFRNINLFDRREMVRGYLRSAEGTQDFLNLVSENAPDIGRRIGVR